MRRDCTIHRTGQREAAKRSPNPKPATCKPLEPGGEPFADFLDGGHVLEQTHTYQFLDREISISGGGDLVGNECSLL